MDRDNVRHEVFTRRSAMLGAGTLLLFAGLSGRMYQLQVVEGQRFQTLAEDNRISTRLLAPPRGRILDRFGVELASNRQNFRIILVPEQADSVEGALALLGRHIALDERTRRRVLREAQRNKAFTPITVVENLAWDQFAAINLHLTDLAGVTPDVGNTRAYPFGAELSHILGYVAAASEKDVAESDDPLLKLPGFRVGRSGIERAVDVALRGKAGESRVEVNAAGRVIREESRSEGVAGDDVVLTLDMEVQRAAQTALSGESGSAVVMDIENGEVIAIVSTPGFDPNAFNVGLTPEQYQALIKDPYRPLFNKTIQGQYPPGSTYKLLVALAALEHGVIDPQATVSCSGKTTLGGHDFHCWKRGGHGRMNFHDGMKHSCDVYFYEIARRLGIDKIEEISHRFGLGETFDFEVPGEKPGLVPGRAWKQRQLGETWHEGETLIVGIGQGYLLTTPLQLCTMTARIANGGKLVMPHIIRSVGRKVKPVPEAKSLGVDPAKVRRVLDAMDAVTNEAGGTAYRLRNDDPRFAISGKTGTAQVRRISREERLTGVIKNEDLPWELRDHALFVCYGPTAAPRYACSVIVDHGGSGSKAAAPRARDIMTVCLERDPARQPPFFPVAAAAPAREG